MIYTAKVVDSQTPDISDSNGATFRNRIRIRIEPLHADITDDTKLPYLRPLTNNENEFSNLNKDDLIYVYTDDDMLNEMYYFGKLNSKIDYNLLLAGIDKINTNLSNSATGATIKEKLTDYNLNSKKIKVMNYGNQIIILDGEGDFTIIADKTSGNAIVMGGGKINIKAGKTEIKISTDGNLSIVADGSDVTLKGAKVFLNAPEVMLGQVGAGYIVTAPVPNAIIVTQNMTLNSSGNIKA